MTYLLLLCACTLTCLGQIAQKLAVESWRGVDSPVASKLLTPWLWAALACLGLGLLLWLLVLQRLEVGIAYPMLSLNFVLVTLVSRFVFKEAVDARHWLGVAVVMGGVVLLGVASMSRATGVTLALGSVALVSGAQLGMRWGMTRLPSIDALLSFNDLPWGVLAVLAGAILAYALSMLCWLGALRDLPLGRAYSMLSISYALVYLLAALLPAFNEHFSMLKTLGVTLVILGVMIINLRPAHRTNG